MNPIVDLGIPAVGIFLMLVVGLELTPEDFRRVAVYPRAVVAGILAQIGLLVPGAALLVLTLDPSPDLAAGLVLVASAPGAAMANYYTYLARANTALAVTLTAVSNLGAVITMPLLAAAGFAWCLGQRVDVRVPFLRTAGTLLFLVLVPIGFGMALRRRRPALQQEHAMTLRRLSLGAVGLLVAVILYDQAAYLPGRIGPAILLATIFTALAMPVGYATGKAVGLARGERFSLVPTFSCRNLGVAAIVSVTSLGRPEFLGFAAMFFLTQVPLTLLAVAAFRGARPRPAPAEALP